MFRKFDLFKAMMVVFAVAFVTVVVCSINDIAGEATDTGTPYTATYSYCAVTTYTKFGSTCSVWNTGTEVRVNTHVKGMWFDHDSYRVVR